MRSNPFVMTAGYFRPDTFKDYGLDDFVFVKPVEQNGAKFFAVHGADGVPISTFASDAIARVSARAYDFEPLSVH